MANTFVISRNHLIFGLCLPVAVLLGYFLAEPLDSGSLAVLVLLGCLLVFPLVLRFHHSFLILSWNAVIVPYMLPGRPALWMLIAFLSLALAVLERSVNAKKAFLHAPRVTVALLMILVVVVVTALLTGGIGSKALGSRTFGGRGYFCIFAAIAGYFALSSRAIPRRHVNLVLAAFFLSGTTSVVSNLVFIAGPKFHFLFEVFPPESAMDQASAEASLSLVAIRITGVVMAASAIYSYLLARYGVWGMLDLRRPWRMAILLGVLFLSLLGGFRTGLVMFGLILAILFLVEGVWKTRAMALACGMGVAVLILLSIYANRMPLAMQRAVSFLPVDVDPVVKQATRDSNEWRLEMWKFVWPEVPKHLFRGKGYAMDPSTMYMLSEPTDQSFTQSYEWAAYAGDYHNGPLSIVIPFGIYGVLAFGWLLLAGVRLLYNNYRHGAPWLRQANAYLLAYFIAKSIFFLLVFGAFSGDLFTFTGMLGLSVALNRGEARPGEQPWEEREYSGLIREPNYI